MTIETHPMLASPRNGAECPIPADPPKRTPRRRVKVKEVDQNQSIEQSGEQMSYIASEFAKGVMVETTNLANVPQSPSSSVTTSSNNGNNKDLPLSPSTSSISSTSAKDDQSSKDSPLPLDNGTKRLKANKRKRSQDDSSLDSGIVPCRKSKRLLFRNTRRTIASKKIIPSESDSVNPYGRVVELIDHEQAINRKSCDLMTKVLFLGCLDLSLKDSRTVVKDGEDEGYTGTSSSTESSRPNSPTIPKKEKFMVPSLKNHCIQSIVKRMKQQFDKKESDYFSRQEEIKKNDEGQGWLNFEEFMEDNGSIIASHTKAVNYNNNADLEECVKKLLGCGTQIHFNTSIPSCVQNLLNVDKTSSICVDDDESEGWSNWMEEIFPSEITEKIKPANSKRPGRSIRKATNTKSLKNSKKTFES